jgi:hypothetical protein
MLLDAPDAGARALGSERARQPLRFGRLGQVSGFTTGFAEVACGVLAVCQLCWLPKNIKSSWQVANSGWPLLFHGTERSLQQLLCTLLKKFMPEIPAYCVGLIGQTHAFIGNLRLAIRMSHLSAKC